MSNSNGLYSGSHLLNPISISMGLPLDQINFEVMQLCALIFAFIFRTTLSHRKVSTTVRHLSSLIMGSLMGYFCFGQQIYHLLVLTTLSYFAILICSPTLVQKVILFLGLTHLTYLNFLRLTDDTQGYSVDATIAVMVGFQRVTNVAFSLNEGLTKSEAELTEEQKRYAIRKIPTILEFFSYLFQFPTLLCGPLVFFNDYIDFIDGHNFEQHLKCDSGPIKEIPSPTRTVIWKLMVSIIFALLQVTVVPIFSHTYLTEPQFLNETPFMTKIVYLILVMTMFRVKYYHAFLLGESICNASGLGFAGFTSDGRPIWNLVSNVDILGFENALSIKTRIESWNKSTQIWLRRIAYERNSSYKLFWTYLLCSLWHGLYPGYYLTFCSIAFFTLAARSVRRCVRHHFQGKGRAMAFIYDCLTYITTKLIFDYIMFPFALLHFWPSIQVYKQLYFCGHILGLFAIFILPRILPPKSNKTHQD